jgi:hypothetical protein
MMTTAELAGNALGSFLAEDFKRTFGPSEAHLAHVIDATAQVALECISNSDALYHNLEHTMLVTLVGRDILRGRALTEQTSPSDWAHFVIACLMHDIGYVRGIFRGDNEARFVIDANGHTVTLPRGASDAALTPHHVDRSKLFVMERLGTSTSLDASRIARAIEFTRFPVPPERDHAEIDAEAGLVRAADLIGQLGDPHYLRKANALFHEFAEIGITQKLGYTSPADLVERYPDFFWTSVSEHLAPAIRYLNVTVSGKKWIAQLHSNVFCAEHKVRLVGPQP